MPARAASPRRRRAPPPDNQADAVRDLIRAHVPAAIAELARLAREASSETSRLSAINALIDRGYGRLKEGAADGDDKQHGITVRFVQPPPQT